MSDSLEQSDVRADRELSQHDVHIWRAKLDVAPSIVASLAATLSPTEQERAARFHFDIHRRRFTVARGRLRQLLSLYTGVPAAEIHIETTTFGKPFVGQPSGFRFSVAHSDDGAAFAFAWRELGVDLERLRNLPDMLALARRFFSSNEYDVLCALPATEIAPAFFRCWTRKEAYLKARGVGLGVRLSSFTVSLDPERPRLEHSDENPDEPSRWSFASWEDQDQYVGAVAVRGEGFPPVLHTFPI